MLFHNEQQYRQKYGTIAGVDEAGRGPLAGPVVIAACILGENGLFSKIDDSKKLTAKIRDELFDTIINFAQDYSIITIEAEEIDRLNILQATLKGMKEAVLKLRTIPDYVLIDGNKIPLGLPVKAESIIKGDGKIASIAAASILAKVTRDRIMEKLHIEYPHYGFAKHKGYPTKEHLLAIERFGVCKYHRQSYKPVMTAIGENIQTLIEYKL